MIMYLQHYNIFQKLFGYGPDLLIEPYHTYFHDQIMEKMGAYLADAHSEFFQILASMGLMGVIGYFGFMMTALKSLLKKASGLNDGQIKGASVFVIAASAGVFGYMIQGLLCSPQPISTPVVFVVMALALARAS
jgi:O-antigen ligase